MEKQLDVENWIAWLSSIINAYDPRIVYNVDELGLFFRVQPSKSLSMKGESCHGVKISKDQIAPQHVFALDFEQNPLDMKADYGVMVYAEPVEVVYNERESGKQGRPEGTQMLIKSALKSGKDLSQRERMAITTRIARMLVLDLQPYIFVENRGFKELMNHMEPLYKIPSHTTFSRTFIPDLCRNTVTAVKERMHADFQEGIESILFTSDMWTSRSNQSYISLTCHYLTSNFEMRSFALDNRSVTESHSGCNILEHLQAMIDNWSMW
ncbi:hypothetical protein HPB49_003232 [Dermacentor silvarum]|uniref:Uncharacterized protein n=1 Tax=Dermacentor silvarum TaxID=543639 RepID=A0ACB8C743_DERSI|nr:hypothetical protein HPB49_003232 [Dermacentor silvarum]